MLPQTASQNHAQRSPFYLSLSWSHKQTPSSADCVLMGFRVVTSIGFKVSIFLQQLSPSGSGVRCSQCPFSSPGPMCHAALDHSVPDTVAKIVTCPNVGPCLQEQASKHVGPKPLVGPASAWFHKCSHIYGEQGQTPRVSKCQSPETESLHQAPKSPYQESELLCAFG